MKKYLVIVLVLMLTFVGCSANENELNETGDIVIEDTENTNEAGNTESNEDVNNSDQEEESTDQDEATEDDSIESDEKSLEEIVEQMYALTGLEFPKMMNTELTLENMEYMLGVSNFEFIKGISSEPMMSSQASSIVLLTVSDDLDIEVIKKDIKENVDGRKWICVGVEDEHILVDHVGDLIVLIMNENSEALMNAFHEVMNK